MSRNGIKFINLAVLLYSLVVFAGGASAQQATPPKYPQPKVQPKPPLAKEPPVLYRGDSVTSEKFVTVDPNVNIKLCVLEGSLKVNGWDRNEVRVFVKDGSRFGMKVLEKDPGSSKPVWVKIISEADPNTPPRHMSDCLWGENVEIDLPMKASLDLKGRVTATTVDSVKKVIVENVEGNISLRNITGGITAYTSQGDVTVENSGGAIALGSSTGNILAYEVNPGQIGDLFKAKTSSGAISLQKVEHRQIDANSISGSVMFNGKFLSGGLYNFKTSNGAIRMAIPVDSSCKIVATYGFGTFNSDIPLAYIYNNNTMRAKNLAATLGSGDATVNVTTTSGSIGIRKQ